ncbi:hypothetical protein NE857_21430 [Nocardiopsis exhalans]|uniref:Uncharacterized protein n=1 Tax=Nocardiopsis exhalans TaxID=163604 RepID=A0ABY5D0T8_9ACTN|nr:hypothetical protein [Nocardiopsis exhalans]USY17879.1 hypothetical protein NE857_21430 [Nocardiopsis exhalans]
MSARTASVRILTCDHPGYPRLVAPPIQRLTVRPSERENRWMLLAQNTEAFAAARAAGWSTSPKHDYCPEHA